jgi:hypothetical protein
MARRAGLRASDSDREQVAERLRAAAAEGRIVAEELEERLGIALRARTYGELDAVVADLPRSGAVAPRRSRAVPRFAPVPAAALVLALPVVFALVVAAVAVVFAMVTAWATLAAILWLMLGHGRRWYGPRWSHGRRVYGGYSRAPIAPPRPPHAYGAHRAHARSGFWL